MTFKALDLARKPVQPLPECRLHSFGIVRRQKGGKRGLDDECLMQALTTGILGKLSRKFGRQTKCMLGPHRLGEAQTVVSIHRGLACNASRLLFQGCCTLDLVIRFVVSELEFPP
jgi:hypothetical protein